MRKDCLLSKMRTSMRCLTFSLLFFLSYSAIAQEVKVMGKVLDDQGDPLPGATILIKETAKGTVTDLEGNYSVFAPSNAVLIFSFVGFTTIEEQVNSRSIINVDLQADTESLDEVVVVGYGTQKKEQVVGAVAQIDGEVLQQRGPVSNLTDAMSGAIPGVTVLTATGLPGNNGDMENSQILIRGKSTWNNSGPLILVDGVERTMNDIDPNDVATMTVLKDASATAVYGVRGGNGVILITTKRGKLGKPKLTIEVNNSFNTASRIPKVLPSFEGIQARNYAVVNELNTNPGSWELFVPHETLMKYKTGESPFAYPSVDWAGEMLRDAGVSRKVNMNVNGGTEFVKYFTSLSYLNDGDILETRDVGQGYNPEFTYERFNFRSNFDFKLTNSTKLSVNLGGYYGDRQQSGAPISGFWHGIYAHPWDVPVLQYEDGVYGNGNSVYERFGENSFVQLNFSGTERNIRSEVNSDFRLDQNLDVITKGLSMSGQFSFDTYSENFGSDVNDDGVLTKWVDPAFYELDDPEANINDYTTFFYPGAYVNSRHGFDFFDMPLFHNAETIQRGNNNLANRTRRNVLYRANLNYNREFGKHSVGGLFLFQRESRLSFSGVSAGFALKREEWVSRISYSYNNTYFFEFNGAYNGSDQFGPDFRFDFFPSFALGYTVSQYDFMKENLPWMNLLKLRLSGGIVGSDRVGGNQLWPYVSTWESSGSRWHFGNPFLLPGPNFFLEGTPGNPNLRWEKARKENFGIETAFFNNKLTANIDLFWEHRTDILVNANQRNVPEFFGIQAPAANLGEVKNSGYELVIGFNESKGDFDFWVTANYAHVKDIIIQKDDPIFAPAYQKEAGFQIGQQRSTMHSGIINSWDELYTGVVGNNNNFLLPGDFRFVDYNGDGVIDQNDNVPFGFPNRPQNSYGLDLGISYKGFSISALFFGVYNVTQDVNLMEMSFNSPQIYQQDLGNTWLPEYGNPNPTFRAIKVNKSAGDGHYNKRDGSFTRLKTAQISYSIPPSLSKRMKLEKARVFLNGNNLFLWSSLPVDVEGTGYDVRNYPVTRQINVGAAITF